jgi:phosphatidylglycerol:prolipoprotein diacylglycerol transferase
MTHALAVIPYPDIDPVLLELGPLALRWYGIAYVVGLMAAGYVLWRIARRWRLPVEPYDVLDIVLAVWDGGMSFHGGLVGMLLGGWVISRRVKVSLLRLADLGAVGAPIGLFLGRVANFIKPELWGRTTDVPWAMVFPGAGPDPRHPSQLYEAFLEGIVLFTVLSLLARKRRPEGFLSGLFLLLYGVFRFLVEFTRQPDPQLGFVLGPFTMGQLLSVPVALAGVLLLVRALRADGISGGDGAPDGDGISGGDDALGEDDGQSQMGSGGFQQGS